MSQEENGSRIPKFAHSYWREFEEIPSFPALQESITTDIAIVGGGIAGIVSAYLLAKAGKKIILLDAGKLIDGATGYTTAKITAQHNLLYSEFIETIGAEQAKLYYEANSGGLKFIQETASELGIACDLTIQNAFRLFGNRAGQAENRKRSRSIQDARHRRRFGDKRSGFAVRRHGGHRHAQPGPIPSRKIPCGAVAGNRAAWRHRL